MADGGRADFVEVSVAADRVKTGFAGELVLEVVRIDDDDGQSTFQDESLEGQTASASPGAPFLDSMLATASSIYQCPGNGEQPYSSLLWRVVGSTLEIMPIGLAAEAGATPSRLYSLKIVAPAPLQRGCLGFKPHERVDPDQTVVHAMTTAGVVYTMILRPDMFTGVAPASAAAWCHAFKPSSFSIRKPFGLASCSAYMFCATLQDGGLVKYDWQNGSYTETLFSDMSYLSSLKGLFTWPGGRSRQLSPNLIVSVVFIEELDALIACTLDCKIKVWSLSLLSVVYTLELPVSSSNSTVDANNGLLNLLDYSVSRVSASRLRCGLVVRPPSTDTELYSVTLDITNNSVTLDKVTKIDTSAPDDLAVWVIQSVYLQQGANDSLDLYVLWKSNLSSQTSRAPVDKSAFLLSGSWNHLRSSDTIFAPGLPGMPSDYSGMDVSELMIRAIFSETSFSICVIVASLEAFTAKAGLTLATDFQQDLKQATLHAVESQARLKMPTGVALEIEDFRDSLYKEWTSLFQLCQYYQRICNDCLSLTFLRSMAGPLPVLACVNAIALFLPRANAGLGALPGSDKSFESVDIADVFPLVGRKIYEAVEFDTQAEFANELRDICQSGSLFTLSDMLEAAFNRTFSEVLGQGAIDSILQSAIDSAGEEALADSIIKFCESCTSYWDFDTQVFPGKTLSNFGRLVIARSIVGCASRRRLLALVCIMLTISNLQSTRGVYLADGANVTKLAVDAWALSEALIQASGFSRPASSQTLLESVVAELWMEDELVANDTQTIVETVCRVALEQKQYISARLVSDWLPDVGKGPFIRALCFLHVGQYFKAANLLKKCLLECASDSSCVEILEALTRTTKGLATSREGTFVSRLHGLFTKHREHAHARAFALDSMRILPSLQSIDKDALYCLAVESSLALSDYAGAYNYMYMLQNIDLKREKCRLLVVSASATGNFSELVDLGFPNLQDVVEDTLSSIAYNRSDVLQKPNYYKLLYAWNIRKNCLQNAAAVLYAYLERLRLVGFRSNSDLDWVSEITESYLGVIGALARMPSGEDWIVVDGAVGPDAQQKTRRLVTLDKIRQEYTDEMHAVELLLSNAA